MNKKYIVRLSDAERETLLAIINKLKGTSQKVRRANILLKADADGPNWIDEHIADAFLCSIQCVENVRKKLVTEGFDIALHGKKRDRPPRAKALDGKQEAEIIALRLSDPPKGRNGWTLSLCSIQCVENVRKKLVTEGFDVALHGKKRARPPRAKALDGKQEAEIIALRLSDPPKGRNGWTLRLLAEKVVELEIAPAVSHTTIRSTLKKTVAVHGNSFPGSCQVVKIACRDCSLCGRFGKKCRWREAMQKTEDRISQK